MEQLKDLYNAEQQLMKALPKMAKAASSEELKAAFEDHLGQTRQHAQRDETIFEQMGEKAKGKTCKAKEGLVEEGGEVIKKEDMNGGIKDGLLADLSTAANELRRVDACLRIDAAVSGTMSRMMTKR